MALAQKKENHLSWLAVISRANQELTLSEKFESYGIEVYAPYKILFRQRCDRKVRVKVPLIKNLIFVRMVAGEAYNFINNNAIKIRFMTDCVTKKILIIPDLQMMDFRRVLDNQNVTVVVNDCFQKGQRVVITDGILAGTHAEVIRYNEQKVVCVRLFEGLCAFVDIPTNQLEPETT